jgi:putative ABC transport system permease protein
MDSFWQDLRYSLRVIAKNPGFAAVAVIALALGIGANTAIFSVVDAVVFRALPYKDPAQLVWATNFIPSQNQTLVFADIYAAWNKQKHVFQSLAAYSPGADFTLTGAGEAERLRGGQVTESFLSMMGIVPQAGRNFTPEEDRPGGAKAVLLTDSFWKRRFGRDPAVVSRVISLNNEAYSVAGVLPPTFEFLDNATVDVLVPFQLAETSITSSGGRVTVRIQALRVVGRLRPGTTLAAAQAELSAINNDKNAMAALPPMMARLVSGAQVQVFSLHDHQVGNVQTALLVLLGAVGFVLLIACANVANLQLARSVAREKEIAIRGALGAGHRRLAQLLLTESSVVALTGGAAGLLFAAGIVQLIRHYGPDNIPHLLTARLDLRVLVFTLGISLLTGLLFGLAPILAAFRVSLNDTLKEGGAQAGSSGGTRRPQRVLTVIEVALSFVLFIGAGLLVRSFLRLTAIETGFNPDRVLTARLSLPLGMPEEHRAFFQRYLERVQATPGVTAAGATAALPLQGSMMVVSMQVKGQPPTDLQHSNVPVTAMSIVTPGYFPALRIPLIAGRYLDERDGANAPKTVVINQACVRKYFANTDPIGQAVQSMGPDFSTVVGVVADVKQRALTSDVMPQIFVPLAQAATSTMFLVVRSTGDPLNLVSALRKELAEIDPSVPLYNVQTMDDVVAAQMASQRFNAAALAAFAGLAVLLAAVGIYGVMAYAVGQRTREIGVRMALGANPANVLRMILRQGLSLAVLGIALGLGASFGLTRLMRTMLYNVKTTDPLTFGTVTAAFLFVALAACWIPARRATRVDPVVALRYE